MKVTTFACLIVMFVAPALAQWTAHMAVSNSTFNVKISTLNSGQSTLYAAGSFTGPTLTVHHGNGSEAFTLDYLMTKYPGYTSSEVGFIVAYDFNGTALWSIVVKGVGYYIFHQVLETPAGNLYATGEYYLTLNPTMFYNHSGQLNAELEPSPKTMGRYVVKLDGGGNVVWLTHFETGQYAKTNSFLATLALGSNGLLYVIDQLTNAGTTPITHTIRNSDGTAAFNTTSVLMGGILVALDQSGNYVWNGIMDSPVREAFVHNAVDPASGHVYTVGFYVGNTTTINGTGSSIVLPPQTTVAENSILARYSANGTLEWVLQFFNGNSVMLHKVAVGPNGAVYVVGSITGRTTVARYTSAGTTTVGTIQRPYQNDGFFASINSAGTMNWDARLGSLLYIDSLKAITIDADGNVIIMGHSNNYQTFGVEPDFEVYHGNGTLAQTLKLINPSKFIVRYSPTGVVLWASVLAGTSFSQANFGVTSDAAKNVYVIAATKNTELFDARGSLYWRTATTAKSRFEWETAYVTKLRSDGTACDTGNTIVDGACIACPLGKYCTGYLTPPIDCGGNSTTSTRGQTSITACICNAGFSGANGTCTECPQGTFCAQNSTAPNQCGPNSNTTTAGATLISACICKSGFYGINGNCTICPQGSFCVDPSGLPIQCGANSSTLTNGATSIDMCLCNAGFYGINGNCTECPQGSFCIQGSTAPTLCGLNANTSSTGATSINACMCNPGYHGVLGSCAICPRGTYCALNSSLPTLCGSNSNTTSAASITISACICDAGFYGTSENCTVCPRGSYCIRNSATPTLCGPNSNTYSTGATSVNDCVCNLGYSGRSGVCNVCPKGRYCDGTSSVPIRCGPNSDTLTIGASSIVNCLCNPGFIRSSGTCTKCPVGTFQSAPGKQTCVPCGDYKVTETTGAASADDCVCAPGTGNVNGTCQPCKDGFEQPDFIDEPCYPKESLPRTDRKSKLCALGTYYSESECVACSPNLVACCLSASNGLNGDATEYYWCRQCRDQIPACSNEFKETQPWIAPLSFVLIALTMMTLLLLPCHYFSIRDSLVYLRKRGEIGSRALTMESLAPKASSVNSPSKGSVKIAAPSAGAVP